MTKKEINNYYDGLEHNCINNYGGYTKQQIEDYTNRLNDDDDEDDYDPWADIVYLQDWEATNEPWADDYDDPY